MNPAGHPDVTPYDALLLVSFGGPEKPEDVVPFLENVTRGRGIPRERLEEVGEHYFLFGGRARSTTRTAPCSRRSRGPRRRGDRPARSTGATATGTPTSPTRSRQMTADGVTAGRGLRHARTRRGRSAGSTARTSFDAVEQARGRARGSTSCGTTSTTRASWSRWSTRCLAALAELPDGGDTAPTWSSSPTRSRSR